MLRTTAVKEFCQERRACNCKPSDQCLRGLIIINLTLLVMHANDNRKTLMGNLIILSHSVYSNLAVQTKGHNCAELQSGMEIGRGLIRGKCLHFKMPNRDKVIKIAHASPKAHYLLMTAVNGGKAQLQFCSVNIPNTLFFCINMELTFRSI